MGDDNVQLTDREREALAGLAEQIGDPWLARQLTGQAGDGAAAPSAEKHHRDSVLRRLNAAIAPAWVAALMVLIGAALAVLTFARSLPAACLGLLVMGAGVWRLVVDHSGVIARRLNERRAQVPAPSSPPRIPPAGP
ncbi:MAG: hypothetical protein M3144_08240 [Actinomycetota bacterium]|nr:hypothetical protein [Actinomycetota bacterium]